MTQPKSNITSEEMQKIMNARLSPYWYDVVSKFSDLGTLNQEMLQSGSGKVSQTLSQLFAKHSINEVSYAPLSEAKALFDGWLDNGSVDADEATRVVAGLETQLTTLQPVLTEIAQSEDVDKNGFGAPLVLMALGNAIQLVEAAVDFSSDAAFNTAERRAAFKDGLAKAQAAKLAAEAANDDNAPKP